MIVTLPIPRTLRPVLAICDDIILYAQLPTLISNWDDSFEFAALSKWLPLHSVDAQTDSALSSRNHMVSPNTS